MTDVPATTIRTWKVQKMNYGKIIFGFVSGIAILFMLAFVTTLVVWAIKSDGFKRSSHVSRNVDGTCKSQDCVFVAAEMLKYIDKTVDPCQDFYQFACGNYEKYVDIPEDRTEISVFGDMNQKVKMQLKHILEDSRTQTKSAQLARTFYRSCMNLTTINRLGVAPLRNLLQQYGQWPLLDVSWKDYNYQWEIIEAKFGRDLGVETFFSAFLNEDPRNSSRLIITIDQLVLNLNSRLYYLNGTDTFVLNAYLEYMVETMKLLGNVTYFNQTRCATKVTMYVEGVNEGVAQVQMNELIQLEVELAKITQPAVERQNQSAMENSMTIEQLKKTVPGVNWDLWFRNVFAPELSVTKDEKLSLPGLEYLRKMSGVLSSFPKRTLANFHMWKLMSSTVDLWPGNLRRPFRKFVGIMTGISDEEPRWSHCVSLTKNLLPWPVSALYVEKHFTENAKIEMNNVVANIRKAMNEQLTNNDWMDGETKMQASKKLSHMSQKIGYPDYIKNETKILTDLGQLSGLSEDEFFLNWLRIFSKKIEKTLKDLRKPVDKNEWSIPPVVVNAFYNPNENEITFPAGILQFPTFVMGVPSAVYYARIGTIIGHEITHGYDDQGSQFDEHGNVRQWWTEKTWQEFNKKSDCFINQYNQIQEPLTGYYVNGEMTLGENIADNGGVKLSHRAYQLNQKYGPEDESLPGLANYTSDQIFFLSFAFLHCSTARPEAVEVNLNTDEHALHRYRVNVPLQNFDKFAQTWHCATYSPMNPKEKCRVW